MLYVLADLDIEGCITSLKWDSHPITPLSMKYLHTWNDNPIIKSFSYIRQVRYSKKSIPEKNTKKNIDIYIEKKYFEQKPENADEHYNPFEIMIIQQFY